MSKVNTVGRILISEEEILRRAREIGQQITKDYKGEEVVVLGTLKGSLLWMSDVVKNINLDVKLDFIQASSYGSSTISSGVVKVGYEPSENMYNRNVIIMEDIVDTGNTLSYIVKKLEERNPKSVKICTMLDKPSRRVSDIKADYIGFEVENLFIVGYGLDYDQRFRNLPYVSYLTEEDVEAL
ncbi:MAG: hypoxanthine phosphoribosyltransferase [Firmicutes bacterium]|nr:hypoxanthine phosphoribosyltransferase [Bacillota bacterium]